MTAASSPATTDWLIDYFLQIWHTSESTHQSPRRAGCELRGDIVPGQCLCGENTVKRRWIESCFIHQCDSWSSGNASFQVISWSHFCQMSHEGFWSNDTQKGRRSRSNIWSLEFNISLNHVGQMSLFLIEVNQAPLRGQKQSCLSSSSRLNYILNQHYLPANILNLDIKITFSPHIKCWVLSKTTQKSPDKLTHIV